MPNIAAQCHRLRNAIRIDMAAAKICEGPSDLIGQTDLHEDRQGVGSGRESG
jgi:hypothetical protein